MVWDFNEVQRVCDVCGWKAIAECKPNNGANQHRAHAETAEALRKHLGDHDVEEIERYLERIHQV